MSGASPASSASARPSPRSSCAAGSATPPRPAPSCTPTSASTTHTSWPAWPTRAGASTRALQHGEPIAVHGDYDADGITAAFLWSSVLQELGADVRSRLPNRFTEGYGVAAATVEELAAAGVKLLITVDCGIGARDEVALGPRPRAWTSSSPTTTSSRGRPAGLHRRHAQARPGYPCPSPRRRRRGLQAGARPARRAPGRARRAAAGAARPHGRRRHRHGRGRGPSRR